MTRLAIRTDQRHAALQAVKNAAYAWRQAVFFLSFCDLGTQRETVRQLAEQVARAGLAERFAPAVAGLAYVVEGGRFTAEGRVDGGAGRRFLGWTTGTHWCLPEPRKARR
ncbi:hypothetical protein [Amycolatopsis orientalis]|uniref:hypothetical protein n=1 Tax=Amycolatopsis orientalis TaxID=31958 RepID=UPI00039A5F07|nr:hypothetical protein [Amycolatopsis orientalis]